ncbi:hypothetical protein RFI_26047, partial [Reticulomyxa filosa]
HTLQITGATEAEWVVILVLFWGICTVLLLLFVHWSLVVCLRKRILLCDTGRAKRAMFDPAPSTGARADETTPKLELERINTTERTSTMTTSNAKISRTIVIVWISLAFGLLYLVATSIFVTLLYAQIEVACSSILFRHSFILVQRGLQYTYFLARLQNVFDGTMYAFNKIFFKLSYGAILFGVISGGSWYYFVAVGHNCSDRYRFIVAVGIGLIWDVIASITLLALFIRNMSLVFKTTELITVNQSQLGIITALDHDLMQMKRVTVKLTILEIVVVCTSLLCFILYLFISTLASMIEMVVNCICLILSFNAYDHWFVVCCKPCHVMLLRKRNHIPQSPAQNSLP